MTTFGRIGSNRRNAENWMQVNVSQRCRLAIKRSILAAARTRIRYGKASRFSSEQIFRFIDRDFETTLNQFVGRAQTADTASLKVRDGISLRMGHSLSKLPVQLRRNSNCASLKVGATVLRSC
jgi:hypothetical protein